VQSCMQHLLWSSLSLLIYGIVVLVVIQHKAVLQPHMTYVVTNSNSQPRHSFIMQAPSHGQHATAISQHRAISMYEHCRSVAHAAVALPTLHSTYLPAARNDVPVKHHQGLIKDHGLVVAVG